MTATAPNEAPEEVAAEPAPAGAAPVRAWWQRAVSLVWCVAPWCVVAMLAWCALSVWARLTTVAPITVLLQSLVPVVFLPAWLLGVAAVLTKRRALVAACAALALAHVVLVWPALGSHDVPRWAASAPKITLLSINMFDRNASPDAAAARVVASHADVLALVEVSAAMRTALVHAGIDRDYPYQLRALPSPDGTTDGIYSRVPFTSQQNVRVLINVVPSVHVNVGGRSLEIVAVHIDGALHGASEWRGELDGLAPIARAATGPFVMMGDYNATRWNPPFRRLLDLHLTDAHEARGQGLSRSWPVLGTKLSTFGPLMRLDHALVNHAVAVERVRDVRIPGSDHVGFEVQLAVGG